MTVDYWLVGLVAAGLLFYLTYALVRPEQLHVSDHGAILVTAASRVLVVDDEPTIIRFLKPALEANGYDLRTAASVAEAIKRIAADTPDIVVRTQALGDADCGR